MIGNVLGYIIPSGEQEPVPSVAPEYCPYLKMHHRRGRRKILSGGFSLARLSVRLRRLLQAGAYQHRRSTMFGHQDQQLTASASEALL